jgi:hypothetical protein
MDWTELDAKRLFARKYSCALSLGTYTHPSLVAGAVKEKTT